MRTVPGPSSRAAIDGRWAMSCCGTTAACCIASWATPPDRACCTRPRWRGTRPTDAEPSALLARESRPHRADEGVDIRVLLACARLVARGRVPDELRTAD